MQRSAATARTFCGACPAKRWCGNSSESTRQTPAGAAWKAPWTAHTLKGVAQNLGFQRLYLSSTALTEALRGPKPLTDPALREAVAMDQAALLTAIQELEG